jgi:hypothetical protein
MKLHIGFLKLMETAHGNKGACIRLVKLGIHPPSYGYRLWFYISKSKGFAFDFSVDKRQK